MFAQFFCAFPSFSDDLSDQAVPTTIPREYRREIEQEVREEKMEEAVEEAQEEFEPEENTLPTEPIIEKSPEDLAPVEVSSNEENQAKFEGDSVDYDPDAGIFIIKGAALLTFPRDGVKLSADRIEYYAKEEKLKAFGNVLITGREQVTLADETEFDLKNNGAFLKETISHISSASIEAREGRLKSSKAMRTADYSDGSFDLPVPIRMGTPPVGLYSFRLAEALYAAPEKILENGQSFTLQAKKLVYYPDRIQNNLYVYGGRLKFKKIPFVLPLPFYIFTAGESSVQMLTLVLGTNPRTGAGDFNIGPKFNFVVGDPKKKRSVSFAPFFQLGSATGYGAMIGYDDPRTRAILAYGAAKDRPLAEVDYRITENNRFIYGWNSYQGGGITRQFLQFNDRRSFGLPFLSSFIEGERLNLWSDLSYIVDSQELRNQENNLLSRLQSDSLGGRNGIPDKDGVRLQTSLFFTTKPIIAAGTEKYNAGIRINTYNAARLYSTGDYNAFTSFGPSLRVHAHRYADFEIGYNQLLPIGQSPFGFDQIIEGQRSAYGNGDFNITRWLSIGAAGTYSLTRQNWVAQQARIIVGPEDFKIMLGYDPVRRQFNFGFSLFFDDKVGFKRFSYRKNTSGKKRRF